MSAIPQGTKQALKELEMIFLVMIEREKKVIFNTHCLAYYL